jgi:REP element-mobilizing transposase RayT
MPYRKCEFRAGECYHLYNRGHNYGEIFFERENQLYFLRLVGKYLSPSVLDVVTYCLMPNHYHLLVCLKTDDLSRPMQRLGLAYTKAVNRRYGRVGALFQGPFQAMHVERDEYLLQLSRYIHLNPVMAGLVERAEDWEFSSYRDYLGLREGRLPKPELVLVQLGSVDAYREFVESYRNSETRFLQETWFL